MTGSWPYALVSGGTYVIGSGMRYAIPAPVTVQPVTAHVLASYPVGDVSLPD